MNDLRYIPPQQDGVLALRKPKGPTSAACIAGIKRRLGQKKIGHAGTLDPMASGVLLVLLGQATKLSRHLMADGEKVYAGTVLLGRTTDTWDAEGTMTEERDASFVTADMIEREIAGMVGETVQEVPPYSAAKHEGKPLYALARKGMETPVKTKTVIVSRAEVEWVDLPRFRFRVVCSSGTYIRSLAHSLGMRLGCGAVLTELTREYSHPFGLADAHDLETVLGEPERFAGRVASIAEALRGWPLLRLDAVRAARVRNGMRTPHEAALLEEDFTPGMSVLMVDDDGAPVALAQSAIDDGKPVWTVIRGLWT